MILRKSVQSFALGFDWILCLIRITINIQSNILMSSDRMPIYRCEECTFEKKHKTFTFGFPLICEGFHKKKIPHKSMAPAQSAIYVRWQCHVSILYFNPCYTYRKRNSDTFLFIANFYLPHRNRVIPRQQIFSIF